MDLYDSVLHSDEATDIPEALTSKLPAGDASADEKEQQYEKVIDLQSLSKLNAKADKTGIVYISRVPPGMGPAKLKHLLSHYGDTGRVYLARDPRGVSMTSTLK